MLHKKFIHVLCATAAVVGLTATTAPSASATTTEYWLGWGRAAYKSTTNHAWVCDDRADGHTVYAVYHFRSPGWFGTDYKLTAPAHNHGCADGWFGKHNKHVQDFRVCLSRPGPDPCVYSPTDLDR